MQRRRSGVVGLALLLAACGDLHAPNLAAPTCGRTATHAFTAGPGECIQLSEPTGYIVFQRAEESGCSGVACLRLESGETGYALARVLDQQPDGTWDVVVASCELVPACP